MQFFTRPKGTATRRWDLGTALGASLAYLSLSAVSPAAAATPQVENLVPAMYSFDSALALLGLRYGVDPGFPPFSAQGSVTDAGFQWTTSGQYLGAPLSLSVTGIFNAGTNSLTWTGGGSYAGVPWAMEGLVNWPSPTAFAIKDSISVGGTPLLFSGTLGNPDFNTGTLNDDGVVISINELATRHWYSFLFGTTTDGWVVTVLHNGVISTNVYTLATDADRVGAKVEGGHPSGTIEFGGTRYVKNGFVTRVPEPATWMLSILGLGLVGWRLRTGARLARRSGESMAAA